MKLLIIGNAGCGKTYLSKKFKETKKLPLFHLDNIWFKPGGYSKEFERTIKERNSIIENIKSKQNYILEGSSFILAQKNLLKILHI